MREEPVGLVLGLLVAGEAVPVGAVDVVLGHPDGVVGIPVRGDGGVPRLVLGGGGVDEVGAPWNLRGCR